MPDYPGRNGKQKVRFLPLPLNHLTHWRTHAMRGIEDVLRAVHRVCGEMDHLCNSCDQLVARLDVLSVKLPAAVKRLEESARKVRATIDDLPTTLPPNLIDDVRPHQSGDADFRRVHEPSPTVAAVLARQALNGQE